MTSHSTAHWPRHPHLTHSERARLAAACNGQLDLDQPARDTANLVDLDALEQVPR